MARSDPRQTASRDSRLPNKLLHLTGRHDVASGNASLQAAGKYLIRSAVEKHRWRLALQRLTFGIGCIR